MEEDSGSDSGADSSSDSDKIDSPASGKTSEPEQAKV